MRPPDILNLINKAKQERSPTRTRQLLQTVTRSCDERILADNAVCAHAWKFYAQGLLALEERTPTARSAQWRSTLRQLHSLTRNRNIAEFAVLYANLAVDCFQDVLNDLSIQDKKRYLLNAIENLDDVNKDTLDQKSFALALSRKSSVLRHLALLDSLSAQRERRIAESYRCARKSVELAEEPENLLELALAEWSTAQHEKTDEKYKNMIQSAEDHLLDARVMNYELGPLALARVYRLTNQPLRACETFAAYAQDARDLRRMYRNSYIYAEAATHLWYRKAGEEMIDGHLAQARDLAERAVSYGMDDARTVVDLAFLKAVLDGVNEESSILYQICEGLEHVSWNKVLDLIAKSSKSDLASMGFALGIEQGAVITRLGTYAQDFLGNESLAKALYELAVDTSPDDPVALTNLARSLIKEGSEQSRAGARRLLSKAGQFANRRFIWWRRVQRRLVTEEREKQPVSTNDVEREDALHWTRPAETFKELRRRYQLLKRVSDVQRRGYGLEGLICELAKLTPGFRAVHGSYRYRRAASEQVQLDGYFEFRNEQYRIECKWHRNPVDKSELIKFADKLDVAGVRGLFISMSGFEETTIEAAKRYVDNKPIVLMDGEEIDAAMNRLVNFDELLEQKRIHLGRTSNPYLRVSVSTEVV